ncbi:MAG: restriction endonuclease subunit S [Gammaproteobacteria bacterium]|nr:restriction endonuclease subunit S [Gammaproteobacteria bacterium]
MIPEGWERQPIKNICESIIDCVNKTAKTVDFSTPYKMIRTTNVRHGRVDTDNVRYVTEEVYKEWIRRGAPKDGDLIFTREAPVGEVGILNDSKGIFLGQRTMMYRAHLDKSDNHFLHYSLQSSYCQKQIENFSNGGTVAHMRVPDCGMIIINTPPLPEQKKIANILSTWDKAIETIEKLIENSCAQKKALMQQLLTGKKRFAEFEGKWKDVKFGDLVNYKKGYTYKSNEYSEVPTDYGFFTLKSINKGGGYNKSGLKYLTHEVDTRFLIKPGDIIFAITDVTRNAEVVGAPVLVPQLNLKFSAISMDMVKLEFKSEIDNKFLFYILKLHSSRNFMRARANGSTVLHLDVKGSKKLPLKIPVNTKEQEYISSVILTVDREIETLELKLNCLKQEKKALMQQLLTGKRRVTVDMTSEALC